MEIDLSLQFRYWELLAIVRLLFCSFQDIGVGKRGREPRFVVWI